MINQQDLHMYAQLKEKLVELINLNGLRDKIAECNVLGADFVKLPSNEYALMKGKEFLVDCRINHYHGQAFTDSPRLFRGRVIDVANLTMDDKGNRSILFATLNAVLLAINKIERTVHCRRMDAEKCGNMLAKHILEKFGRVKIAHIGFQPGHAKATSAIFNPVYITDLDSGNIEKVKFGVKIINGAMNEEIIRRVDVACITGSTIVNGTLFRLLELCQRYGVKYILYGVTIKGAAKILGYDVFCPLSCDETVLPSGVY